LKKKKDKEAERENFQFVPSPRKLPKPEDLPKEQREELQTALIYKLKKIREFTEYSDDEDESD